MGELIDIVREKLGRIWEAYYGIPREDYCLSQISPKSVRWDNVSKDKDEYATISINEVGEYTITLGLDYPDGDGWQGRGNSPNQYFHLLAGRFGRTDFFSHLDPNNTESMVCGLQVSKSMEVVATITHLDKDPVFQSADHTIVALARGFIQERCDVGPLLDEIDTRTSFGVKDLRECLTP